MTFCRSLDSIIVAHQGNDKKSFFTNLANANGALVPLDPTLFPNVSKAIQVYQGFASDHNQSVVQVFNAVTALLGQYPQTQVTVVGFSLGAGIAMLDGLLFRMLLNPATQVRVVTYAMPRIGNPPFAGFVDAILPQSVKHIGNKKDPMPVVPAVSLGYAQVSGEIHIQGDGKWISCPGEDNYDPRGIAGTVTSINNANFADHLGPYNNILMQCTASTGSNGNSNPTGNS